jgi:hypothetical protein
VSAFTSELEARAAFRRMVAERLEEARGIWEAYAESRRLRFVRGAAALPRLEGRIANTDVTVAAVGSNDLGYRTLATAEAKVALGGTLRIRPIGPSLLDELAGLVRPRYFDDPVLQRLLVVKASSRSFAKTLLDARVTQTVRTLAPAQLRLSYVGEAISIEWGGVERDAAILDDVLDVLAYLAVQGSEDSPYR